MPAHLFVPLLAVGSLVLTGAFIALIQPRFLWLRWMGAGVLISTGLSALLFLFMPVSL